MIVPFGNSNINVDHDFYKKREVEKHKKITQVYKNPAAALI